MLNFKNVVMEQLGFRREGLVSKVLASMVGLDSNTSIPIKASPEVDYRLRVIQVIERSQDGWDEIAQAVKLVTMLEPDRSDEWLKMVSQTSFPVPEGVLSLESGVRKLMNIRSLGCFLGVLRSIEWMDRNSPENSPNGENMQIILRPFLIDPKSFNIETSDQGFQDAQSAKQYHGQLSDVMDSIADVEHVERWIPIIKELTELQLSSDNYFHDEFLVEWSYSAFGSLKESYHKAAVLLWAHKARLDEDAKNQQPGATE